MPEVRYKCAIRRMIEKEAVGFVLPEIALYGCLTEPYCDGFDEGCIKYLMERDKYENQGKVPKNKSDA